MEFWSDADPGLYWKRFVDEKQDPNKNDKVQSDNFNNYVSSFENILQ